MCPAKCDIYSFKQQNVKQKLMFALEEAHNTPNVI